MTLEDDVKLRGLRQLGLREAEIKACMQHVKQELSKDSLFQEYALMWRGNIWELPIQSFELENLNFVFEKFVMPLAFRWITYRYYDLLDER